ncbi:hypothetical protein GGR08_001614 [Bartonella fuyuanensis]|uniref:Phage related protein n=1 Tax=Bartonella fuyuanensis TaxID=1460968 RepID=A0A840E014_9HYPH|nr:hypothetical protein [Bartonella fuyuanensis]
MMWFIFKNTPVLSNIANETALVNKQEPVKKYELTNETHILEDRTLHRIRALKDFDDIKVGALGSFIEKEVNLSHDGNCWVYDDAYVYGHVYGSARALADAHIYDHVAYDATVFSYARVYGHAKVSGSTCIYSHAKIYNYAVINGRAKIYGKVYGNAKINKKAK